MSKQAEKLQDAIGMIDDEYIVEAHGEEEERAAGAMGATAGGAGAATGDKGAVAGGTSVAANATGEATGEERTGVRFSAPQAVAGTGDAEPSRNRGRRASWKPLALAACLVIAAGIGVFAMMNATPWNKAAAPEKASVAEERVEPSAAASAAASRGETMTTEAEGYAAKELGMADGATDGASSLLAPGHPSEVAPPPSPSKPGEALVLTAGVWDDNSNWPFFANLVNAGTIGFPSFGIDPTHRVKVQVVDKSDAAVRGEAVNLVDADGKTLWSAKSDKSGNAYLFFREGETPASVVGGGAQVPLTSSAPNPDDRQGAPIVTALDEVKLTVGSAGTTPKDLQVMFIVDTTGSMADEIAYLQADFASISGDVGSDGVSYSVNFYRDEGDEYVTKCNDFTSDVSAVQGLLNKEYADGGGDAPEAVATILDETITSNGSWRDDSAKIAFLIFDAPPHEGNEATIDAAVRSAAERGIRVVPVVASNADRETELFGRALAICTDGTYVFLTDDSGVGDSHLEPIVGDYTVEKLHDVIVRLIGEAR